MLPALLSKVDGKKTYLLCAGVIIGAWCQVAMGTLDLQQAIDATEAALVAMAMRHGVTKSGQ